MSGAEPRPALEIEDLHKSYEGRPVLNGITLRVAPSEVLGVIGRSGSGKSVLLRHVVGLVRPDRGRIRVAGIDITAGGREELFQAREKIGFLFQGSGLLNSLTVFENVALPLRERGGLDEEEIRGQVMDRLQWVDLANAADRHPSELSGGMRKRAGLARAIVGRRELFLYDEPTAGLDPVSSRSIGDLILRLHRQLRATTVVVSHDLPFLFGRVTRAALLLSGRIEVQGTPAELQASTDPRVRQFLDAEAAVPASARK